MTSSLHKAISHNFERLAVMALDMFVVSLPCPKCENTGDVNVLPFSPEHARQWYLRCWACGYVRALPKDPKAPPPAPPTDI
jgi:hypothetical protein